jgi:hypothetical protein
MMMRSRVMGEPARQKGSSAAVQGPRRSWTGKPRPGSLPRGGAGLGSSSPAPMRDFEL